MIRRSLLILILFVAANSLLAQDRMTRQEYIDAYAELAMEEMKRTGIPASITLAQGVLESDNGNSSLATKGRNHFGIKCHDWEGRKMYHDDDEKDECFRVYRSDEESYLDHSEFLTTKDRYASLFDLKPDDYKAWAKGLKKAGYATSNKYADLLIKIIEDNELYVYDQEVLKGDRRRKNRKENEPVLTEESNPGSGREIYTKNRTEYILAEEGDSWLKLREEFDLYRNELYRYNNVSKSSAPVAGMPVYLQPKRWKAEKGQEEHVLQEGETMWDISQLYGVKLRCLYWRNRLEPGTEPGEGTKITLRKRIPSEKGPREKKEKDSDQESPVKLEFSDF